MVRISSVMVIVTVQSDSELERKGFIEVKSGTRQCTSKNLHRTPNEYTLIGKWKDYVPSESEKRIIGKKSDAENKTHAHY